MFRAAFFFGRDDHRSFVDFPSASELLSTFDRRIDPSATFGHFIPACDSLVVRSQFKAPLTTQSPQSQDVTARVKTGSFPSFCGRRPSSRLPKELTHERRFLCTMLSSKNKECTAELAKKLKPGRQCYTKCGEPQCPEGDFLEPSPAEDFKYLHCEGGAYRTRCRVRKEEKPIEFNPVAVPIVVPVE
ncbi:hypothetical protein Esti_002507 [Eimeria stiedai]